MGLKLRPMQHPFTLTMLRLNALIVYQIKNESVKQSAAWYTYMQSEESKEQIVEI